MGLTNCPECGKENVSDSAEACPNCGYGIKTHFDKVRQEERKEQELKAEQSKQQAEIDKKKQEQKRIKNVSQPIKPTFSRGLITYSIVATIVLSWLFLYLPTTYHKDVNFGMWFFEVLIFIGAPLLIYNSKYNKQVIKYNLAKTDFEAYQRQIIQEQDRAVASAQEAVATRAREEAKKPECPYCHSKDTKKISGLSKAGGVALWGVFAIGKVSKQWHCNNCKSDF